jgi:predicted RNase H-like HicB family nuclease
MINYLKIIVNIKWSYFIWKAEVEIMNYRVLIFQDEDGFFIAECPSLPGCISQGKTRKEVKENIRDAIYGYLESLKKHNEPIPPSIEEEIIEVTV